MIRATMDLCDEEQFEEIHDDGKSMLNKDLMRKVERHGRNIHNMKNKMLMLDEKISTTSHATEGEGGEDNVGHDVLSGDETVEQDHVRKCCDLNVEVDVGPCEDISTLQAMIPFGSGQTPTPSLRV
ncbi:hypothetical protein DEO72_LG10g2475 [Vigna unguiculata]|uniref:Uncharacterized protein n=1 Tax=Vigna unguiculata TaxID=3917 RepID=A0A4D6NED2_VIGUN|nr:hypothetical protein DEO72_LG10g2475 [Vigna unguiculata]